MMLEIEKPKVVALLDDNEDDLESWRRHLAKAGIEAIAFTEKDSFAQCMARGDHFDAVILDWIFQDESSSIMAQLVLEQCIRPHLFVPVLVYTAHSDMAEDEIKQLQPPFNRMSVISKDDIDATDLAAELEKWYTASISARLARVWRTTRRQTFEQTLYTLDTLEGLDLQITLQHLFIIEEEALPDLDQAIEFLERFVGRQVSHDDRLRKALQVILSEAGSTPGPSRSQPLVHAHRYIPVRPDEKIIRMGDVVDVCDDKDGEYLLTGVVITPACDLEQRKCRELRLLVAQKGPPHVRSEQWWPLEAVQRPDSGVFEEYWLNFHQILCLIDKTMSPDAKKSHLWKSMLSYNKVYEDIFGKKVRLKPICRLDDPYRSDLLQKFSSHAARVGIP